MLQIIWLVDIGKSFHLYGFYPIIYIYKMVELIFAFMIGFII